LTSLTGAPKKVKGSFNCSNNQLSSLDGAPKKVKGDFDCSGNQLTTLDGTLKKVGGDFICGGNTGLFSEDQARVICSIKGNCITV
jgi:hypothetical protein